MAKAACPCAALLQGGALVLIWKAKVQIERMLPTRLVVLEASVVTMQE